MEIKKLQDEIKQLQDVIKQRPQTPVMYKVKNWYQLLHLILIPSSSSLCLVHPREKERGLMCWRGLMS